ncbi:MAG TPA: 2-oxo acid dehydrogenase subunit E2 [Galbitalea sp.]|jgi:pyruvate dehydrogenase E2 component (dihydrolipoamide acetyltransferase)|nr:2-oxo acid dehydrogenase subunit E2 [Galbitalea sp.]
MDTVTQPERIPLSRMRRAIARSMTASAQIPQFTVEVDASIVDLGGLRSALRDEGIRISYSDAIVVACAAELVAHPIVNASFDGDALVVHPEVHVGIAVSLDDGLVAPAIRNADKLSLREIESDRVRLTQAAQDGTLSPEDLLCATFTISNLGPLGISRFRALVVPPQAAILAVGAIDGDGRISLALSCDHRVLDGAPAARFLAAVVARLQDLDWVEALARRHSRE